ncbi:MAG: putative metal-binding motif-containing protein [Pseudomonadota bacterium]
MPAAALKRQTAALLVIFSLAAFGACMGFGTENDNYDTGEDAVIDPFPDSPAGDMPSEIGMDVYDDAVIPGDGCDPCYGNADCDDGVFCNGIESCDMSFFNDATSSFCCVTEKVCQAAADPCMQSTCIEEMQACTETPLDQDGDGYASQSVMTGGELRDCRGTDCDDDTYKVHPGAAEICDGLDNDCDNLADEDAWKAAETPLRISRDGSDVLDAAMGALADKWVVAWVDALGEQTSICVARYGIEDLGGSAPAAPCFDTAGPAGELDIAMTGSSDFYVFWIESNESIMGRRMWYETRLQMDGAALIFGPEPAVSDIDTALEPDGGHAGIFFKSDRTGNFEIHMIRASLPGLVPAEEALRVSRAVGFSGHPSAAAGPEAYGVAWQDDRDGNMEIYFSTFGFAADGAGNNTRLTVAPGDSMHPSLTATPGGFFLAWMDESSGPLNIFAVALDGDGAPKGYPAAIGYPAGASEYPAALLDSREPGFPDQNMIAYVRRASGEDNKIFLTAAGPDSTSMDKGVELHSAPVNIKHAAVSGEGDSRAALWAEGDYTEKELYFTLLECM